MTRKEQIEQAATDHAYIAHDFEGCDAFEGFIQGAEWADDNPETDWDKHCDKVQKLEQALVVAKEVILENINNFECYEDCQCCNNNSALHTELTKALEEIERLLGEDKQILK